MLNNLTIAKAILIGSFAISTTFLINAGSMQPFIAEAEADVAGMDYRDLRRDRDFKKAVKYIVENCSVSGSVDGEDIDASISC